MTDMSDGRVPAAQEAMKKTPEELVDPPPFDERLLACQSPPLITRFRQRGHRGKTISAVKKTAEGRWRRVKGAMVAAPDPLARRRQRRAT
jgi:hypothetical protein